jgi:hypothetical protein
MGTRDRIRGFIAEAFWTYDDFPDDVSLLRTGIVGTGGLTYLAAYLEVTFGITVDEDEIVEENLDSVDRAAELVARKIRSAA